MSIKAVRTWMNGGETTDYRVDQAALQEIVGKIADAAGAENESLLSAFGIIELDNGFDYDECRAILKVHDHFFGSDSSLASIPAVKMEEIKGLMRAGNKIAAIKIVRSLTGLRLKEAKDAVEALDLSEEKPATPVFKVGDRVVCLSGLAKGCEYPGIEGIGTILSIEDQSIRVDWPTDFWWHWPSELVHAGATPSEPRIITEARNAGYFDSDDTRRLVVAMLQDECVAQAWIDDGDETLSHTVIKAARGVSLLNYEIAYAIKAYDKLTGRENEEARAAREQVTRLEAELAEARKRLEEVSA